MIDPYETLAVNKDATQVEVRRAYHKLCLRYHPDKAQGAEDTREQFDAVQLAYLVLSDEKKRARYDRTGVVSVNDGDGDGEGDFDWDEYFTTQFTEVSAELIEQDRQAYQGSAEERSDMLRAFVDARGDMKQLFESVIHLEFTKDEEQRVYELCTQFVEEEGGVEPMDVPLWKQYVRQRKQEVAKMERARKREAKAAKKERVKVERGRVGKAKTNTKTKANTKVDDMAALQLAIAGNARRGKSRLDEIIDKYS